MAEDRYANWGSVSVTEEAAGTLTFQEKLTGVGFGTGKGMLIDQIDYFMPAATLALYLGTPDRVDFGLTSSVGVTNLEDIADSRMIHSAQLIMRLISGGDSHTLFQNPMTYQFFPSIILAHQRIFLAIKSDSLAAAATIRCRFYWRFVDLTDRNIAELVQSTLLQG